MKVHGAAYRKMLTEMRLQWTTKVNERVSCFLSVNVNVFSEEIKAMMIVSRELMTFHM